MKQYVALLRGINVGRSTKVPMADLKTCLESLGYTNVVTILNSGNVIFSTDQTNPQAITKDLEEHFAKQFGFFIAVFVIPSEEFQKLLIRDPFKNIQKAENTRCYLTFVPNTITDSISFPYTSPEKNFHILSRIGNAICSVVTLSSTTGTPDLMAFLEKSYGRQITTRTWDTIQKILMLLV